MTETEFGKYLEKYHVTLQESAERYLPVDERSQLWHLCLLPAKIVGTVSTQFGVAFEYDPAASTTISVQRTSQRVEDAVVTCPKKLHHSNPLLRVERGRSIIVGINFEGSFPFRLLTEHAHVAFHQCLFTAADWVQSVYYIEAFGNRSAANWTQELAVSRAKDLVLQATVDLAKAKEKSLSLDTYIAQRKKFTVLLLGSYSSEGRARLERIAQALRQLGYDPLLVDEVEDHPSMDLAQKVTVLGSMSRFVVVDDSSISGHVVELMLCKNNNWITVVLRRDSNPSTFMVASLSATSSVIRECNFDVENPIGALSDAAKWAEERVASLERSYKGTYPWRQPQK